MNTQGVDSDALQKDEKERRWAVDIGFWMHAIAPEEGIPR